MNIWIGRIKKGWIVTQMVGMMLTMFFALFIPAMYLNFKLLERMIGAELFLIESLIVFVLIAFGLLLISIAIAGKIMFYYNDLFEWDKA